MNRSDSPKKQPVPFGLNGQRENILSTTPAGDNTASYDVGFPPVTMILKAAGGLPPKGQDMNQILFELSSLARWQSAGAINTYDASFASSIQGYPKGSVLLSDDGTTIFISTTEANAGNPNSTTTGWLNLLSFLGGAPIASPTFSGTPSVPDIGQGNYGQQIANSKFVRDAINVVIGAAPESLNTLAEIAQAIGNNPNFSNDISQSISNLDNAKMAKAANGSDIANKATFRTNLGLLSAAVRDVGTGANQIPDMSSFPLTATQTGWTKLPNGIYMQWGVTPSTTGTISASFPIAFPNACLWLGKNTYSSGSSATSTSIIEIVSPTRTGFTMSNIATLVNNNTAVAGPVNAGIAFFAIGY